MAIFNCYVSSPEGIGQAIFLACLCLPSLPSQHLKKTQKRPAHLAYSSFQLVRFSSILVWGIKSTAPATRLQVRYSMFCIHRWVPGVSPIAMSGWAFHIGGDALLSWVKITATTQHVHTISKAISLSP